MAFRMQQYLYAAVDGLRKLSLSENGSNVYTFTLTSSKTVTDALAEWTSLANASGDLSGTYLFVYDDSTSLVTLGRTDGGQFYYRFEGSLATALGFGYTADLSPQAISFTSSRHPAAICNPISITHDPPEAAVEVSKKMRRLGRASMQTHYGAMVTECEALFTSAIADVLLSGPMFNARALLQQDHTETDSYSVTDTTGNLDTYGHTISKVERLGYNEGHTRVRWVASVAE